MWQKLKNLYHLLVATSASFFFGFPSKRLMIIGVTGTDGKTTTVHMIYEILKSAGNKVSMISSVNAQICSKAFDTGFHVTTPSPWQIQRYLKKAADCQSKYFVLEATSHGLDQNRLASVRFKVATLTNITHEHLDYHKNWRSYVSAKAKLFKNAEIAVLNRDDRSFNILKSHAHGQILTYSLKGKSDFNLQSFPIKLKVLGDYNLSNAQAAAATSFALGINKKIILKTLADFGGVLGRMEEISLSQNFGVFVDFAHTPNALEQALKTLKSKIQNPKSKLIAVFGAAGERDILKRPLMGQVAAKFTDISVVTAEDPRREKVEDICNQIAQGFIKEGKKEGRDFYQVFDREKAIELALNLARKGDIVATFGKSHEKSMCWGSKEYPWDEFKVIEKALKKRLNAPES